MSGPPEAIHEGSQFRKILTHTPWYVLSSLLSKAIGFLLLPIYTRYLAPSDYGILASLQSFGILAAIALSLYMDAAYIRFYYQERTISRAAVKKLYSTYFWFIVAWGSISAVMLIYLGPILMEGLLGISLLPVVLVIVTQLLAQLSAMVLGTLRADLKAKQVAMVTVGNAVIVAGLTVLLLIPYEQGWMSQIYAALLGMIVQTIFLVSIAVRAGWIGFQFDRDALRQGLIYAVPLIPNVAAGWIAGFSDRLILIYYGRLVEVGLYSVAYQFAYLLYVFNDAVTQVQGPVSMSGLTSDRERARLQIVEFVRVYVWVMALLYLGMTLFSREVIEWFLDPRYQESYKVIAILASIYAISGLYRVFSNVVSFHNKTWIISTAAILQALINIILNFTFIPLFGMYAAAWSSLFSLVGYLCWIVYWSQKLEPINLPWRAFSATVGGVMMVLLAWYWLDHAAWTPMMLVYKILLLAGFVVCTLRLKSLQKVRELLAKLFLKIFGREFLKDV